VLSAWLNLKGDRVARGGKGGGRDAPISKEAGVRERGRAVNPAKVRQNLKNASKEKKNLARGMEEVGCRGVSCWDTI